MAITCQDEMIALELEAGDADYITFETMKDAEVRETARFLAKLSLNSIWGFLALKGDFGMIKFVKTLAEKPFIVHNIPGTWILKSNWR